MTTPHPTKSAPAPSVTYTELPDFDTVEQRIYAGCRRFISVDMLEPIHNLIRDAIDADRAMRAQAAPASQDAATGLKDGDIAALVNRLRDIAIEYSGTQQLRERIASEIRPRAAGLVGVASQDAEDAARYRLLRCKVAIFGDSFHILNIRPTFVAPDPAVELDAVLDAAREPRPLD